MKWYHSVVFLMALSLMTAGCNSEIAQGPSRDSAMRNSARNSAEDDSIKIVVQKPIVEQPDRSFSLSVPADNVSLIQGMEQTLLVGINRGREFRDTVDVKVVGLPAGVTVDSTDLAIEPGDAGITLILKAAGDAAPGEFTVQVTGHSSSGSEDVSAELKITVSQQQ